MHADYTEATAARAYGHVTATARKSGRSPARPFVPVLVYGPTEGNPGGYTSQVHDPEP